MGHGVPPSCVCTTTKLCVAAPSMDAVLRAVKLLGHTHNMAANEVVPGPIADNVIRNVLALRKRAGLSQVGLSKRLAEVGHPIQPTGIQRLENGKRRVDPDDLVALALALDVAPITLLLPPDNEAPVKLTEVLTKDVDTAWLWAVGRRPIDGSEDYSAVRAFHERSLPRFVRSYDLGTDEGRIEFTRDHPEKVAEQLKNLQAALEGNDRGQRG